MGIVVRESSVAVILRTGHSGIFKVTQAMPVRHPVGERTGQTLPTVGTKPRAVLTVARRTDGQCKKYPNFRGVVSPGQFFVFKLTHLITGAREICLFDNTLSSRTELRGKAFQLWTSTNTTVLAITCSRRVTQKMQKRTNQNEHKETVSVHFKCCRVLFLRKHSALVWLA